jgi:hypothetical protein
MNSNDILTGLRVPSQVPLDSKAYSALLSSISTLGTNNQLAYSYFDGLIIFCNENKKKYIWEPINLHVGETGLLTSNFTYPTNYIVEGVTYSNKIFNLFEVKGTDGSETKVTAGSNVTVSGTGTTASPYVINSSGGATPDATSTVKGILKLTNDLGGTADLPTTPTAVHKTGNETIQGVKQIINSLANQSRFNFITSSDATLPVVTVTTQSSTVPAVKVVANTSSSEGIEVLVGTGDSNAISVKSDVIGAGASSSTMLSFDNVLVNNDITPIRVKKQGVEVLSIDYLGNIFANTFVKSGGTSTQRLMADGSVQESNPQKEIGTNYNIVNADNNQTIFINNGATPITITLNSSVTTPNFCVGFIQEGTGDVNFVSSGVSLTNPTGLKSKGQGQQTFIERKLSTNTFYLLGNTKA